MNPSTFTDEQIAILAKNPYTLSVTQNNIRFTLAFKKAFWLKRQAGARIPDIFRDLGYDINIIGKTRSQSIAARIRLEALSPTGLHEGNKKREIHPTEITYSQMSQDEALVQMQHELMYLRQEMDFIKKIIKSDNSNR